MKPDQAKIERCIGGLQVLIYLAIGLFASLMNHSGAEELHILLNKSIPNIPTDSTGDTFDTALKNLYSKIYPLLEYLIYKAKHFLDKHWAITEGAVIAFIAQEGLSKFVYRFKQNVILSFDTFYDWCRNIRNFLGFTTETFIEEQRPIESEEPGQPNQGNISKAIVLVFVGHLIYYIVSSLVPIKIPDVMK